MNKMGKERNKRHVWILFGLLVILFISDIGISSVFVSVFVTVLVTIVFVIILVDMFNASVQAKREQKEIWLAQSDQRAKEQEILEKKKKEILEKWVD